ncbi:PPR domain protein [Rhizoctonia solani 123E]|uniref:PPR domain protein n=1 Tax=Rhizoctonia solani 123E TaxID=1423351 RepID=A0A074RY12_9AGAM|nr:PPR domain protein [Rhizoctonia solani 123E]
MIARATRTLCNSCRIRFDHTSTFIKRSCVACPKPARWSSFAALQRGSINSTPLSQDDTSHYSEQQLQSLYSDLFSSLPSAAQPIPALEGSIETLQALQDRFGLDDASHRALINHIQTATELITTSRIHLGLVLDTEWETIIRSALDARDLEYALKGLDILKDHRANQVENLDLRLLNHPYLMQDVYAFSQLSDKLYNVGYPVSADRLSYLVASHLHSHLREQPRMIAIKSTQDLIHKLEAQGTPPSQDGYATIMRAYLDASRDSNLLSETGTSQTNPSAAIAAVHDLFTHMRYVAHPNPSLETYSVVIAACARGRQVNPLRALELLQEIKQGLMSGRTELIQPQLDISSLVACYNGTIRACARAGARFAGDAFRLAKELVQPDGIPIAGATISGIGPDRKTMTALMHSAKRIGDLARTRWILTEVMRAQLTEFENGSEAILDEEIMVCAFQAYSAFRPSFRREMTRNQTEEPEGTAIEEDVITAHMSAPTYTIPQSAPEALKEADILLSRILSKHTTSPDHLFSHVPISARIMNAYLGIYYSHAPLERALVKFEECYSRVEPNAYTFVNLLEHLARAAEPDRQHSLAFAKKTWINWQVWIQRVNDGQTDPILAEATPRAIERAWAAIIRIHSLCDDVETALTLLREFVTKYPPACLNTQSPSSLSTQRSRLEHLPPLNSDKSLTTLLATPTPRVGLLVRFTTPEQITEPGIGPHLLFSDLTLLHQRLVSRHSYRKADIAFVTWACKSYELQLKRRRDRALGVVKPARSKTKLPEKDHPGDSSHP